MCGHSWGNSIPTAFSHSQPLSSYFTPDWVLVPQSLSCTSVPWRWLWHSSGFSAGFGNVLCLCFLHLPPPKQAAGWALMQAAHLPAPCCLFWRPAAAGMLLDLLLGRCQHHGRVGVLASFSLSFPHPSLQE